MDGEQAAVGAGNRSSDVGAAAIYLSDEQYVEIRIGIVGGHIPGCSSALGRCIRIIVGSRTWVGDGPIEGGAYICAVVVRSCDRNRENTARSVLRGAVVEGASDQSSTTVD